jgi:glyoxylase-like metal-dependent hydrolase (beta-lactamase superfamily II)
VTFHFNDDEIHVVHVANAHTDGDAIVHWSKANVLHLGDTFFNGSYPFIDLGSGGSINGLVAAVDAALRYANDQTRIIPGHGALAGRADLLAYRAVIAGARDAVQQHVAAGHDIAATLAARPTAQWDDTWGKAFINPETFVRTLYESLKK